MLARLTGCNIAGLNFFVRSQAVPAKAISRIYAKTTAAPAKGACRPIRMRTCKVTSSLIADLPEPIFLEGWWSLLATSRPVRVRLGLAFMAPRRNFAVVFDRGVSSTDLADCRAASAISARRATRATKSRS